MEEPLCSAPADDLEQQIWSLPAGELKQAEPDLRARFTGVQGGLSSVLAELSDETLALAFQKGLLRREVFEEWLVNRYDHDLVVWFLQRTGNPDLARDLTHELYLRLLRGGASTYQPERLFLPWLRKVVDNLVTEHFRRPRPGGEMPAAEAFSASPSPEQEASARETQQRFEAAVLTLPHEQQRVIREAARGADAEVIAAGLNVPKRRVYRLLFKARRALERLLYGEHAPPWTGDARRFGSPPAVERLTIP